MTTLPVVFVVGPLAWTYFTTDSTKLIISCVMILFTTVVFLSALCTVNRDNQMNWMFQLGQKIVKLSCSYFSYKLEFENFKAIEETGPCIFLLEPHGVLPVSIFWGSLEVLPHHKVLCCLSDAIFTVPLMKHILTWCGAVSADKKTMLKSLKEGYSLNICPGGVQEVQYLASSSKECVLFLKQRTGLIKLAKQEGVSSLFLKFAKNYH